MLYEVITILKVMEPIQTDRIVSAAFVLPMSRNPEFCRFMHIIGPNLNFENRGRIKNTGMERLIAVLFRNGDIIFKT